jgi:hypothetical protein
VDILGNLGHTMVHMLFPKNDAIFQEGNSLMHTATREQSCFEEHGDALKHFPWPA